MPADPGPAAARWLAEHPESRSLAWLGGAPDGWLVLRALRPLGVSSVALAADHDRAQALNAYARGAEGTLDTATAHAPAVAQPAERVIVAWIRAANDLGPAEERIAVYGVDPSNPAELAAVRAKEARRGATLLIAPDAADLADGWSPLPRADARPADEALPTGPLGVADVAARILARLPGTTHLRADEASGAPAAAWGDWFFFRGDDRFRPFATIVTQDVPGFDEESRLARPGAFRVNAELGRERFTEHFGFRPADLPARRAEFDFAAADTLLPHPAYGTRGWACLVNPTPARLAELDRLVAGSRGLADARAARAARPGPSGGAPTDVASSDDPARADSVTDGPTAGGQERT